MSDLESGLRVNASREALTFQCSDGVRQSAEAATAGLDAGRGSGRSCVLTDERGAGGWYVFSSLLGLQPCAQPCAIGD